MVVIYGQYHIFIYSTDKTFFSKNMWWLNLVLHVTLLLWLMMVIYGQYHIFIYSTENFFFSKNICDELLWYTMWQMGSLNRETILLKLRLNSTHSDNIWNAILSWLYNCTDFSERLRMTILLWCFIHPHHHPHPHPHNHH